MGLRSFATKTVKNSVKLSRKAGKGSVNAARTYAPKVKDATISGVKGTGSFAKDMWSAAKEGWKEDLS